MSIFSAPKEASRARAAFAAAGLNFETFMAGTDDNVIKNAIAAGKSATATAPELAAAEQTLAAAAAENTTLKAAHATALADLNGKLATANAALAKQTALAAAGLKAAGLTDGTPEALTAGIDKKVEDEAEAKAVAKIAGQGHPGFDDTPGAAGSGKKKQAAAATGLTGLAQTEAALKARKAAANN